MCTPPFELNLKFKMINAIGIVSVAIILCTINCGNVLGIDIEHAESESDVNGEPEIWSHVLQEYAIK